MRKIILKLVLITLGFFLLSTFGCASGFKIGPGNIDREPKELKQTKCYKFPRDNKRFKN